MESLSLKKGELLNLIRKEVSLKVKEEFKKRENFLGYEKISKKEEKELDETLKKDNFTSIDDVIKKL